MGGPHRPPIPFLEAFVQEGMRNIMEKAIKRYWPVFVLPTLLAFTLDLSLRFSMGVYLSFCKFTTVTDAKSLLDFQTITKIFTDASLSYHALWYTALVYQSSLFC